MKGQFHVIDSNRHVMEPSDLWDTWLEAPFKGQVSISSDVITVKDRPVTSPQPGFVNLPAYKRTFDAAVTAGFSSRSNLADMDKEGVDAAVLLPTQGMYIIWADHIDTALSAALCRAYNNWMHSYCQADPRRLKAVALVPLQGEQEAVTELRRAVQELGCVAVYMRPNPLLKRKLHDPAYDSIYAEAESLRVPVLLHEGSGSVLHQLGKDRQQTIFGQEGVLEPFEMMLALMSFMGHNVLERFPELKVGYLGSGSGWLPYWLERVDEHWGGPFGIESASTEAPSILFKRQGFVTVEPGERTTPEVIAEVGDNCLVWGSQYPYPRLTDFPNELDSFLAESLLSDESKRKILWDNASSTFGIS